MFERSYEMAQNSPPSMEWEAYAAAVRKQLSDLLASGNCDEAVYQRLIEQHPCLLPWFYGTFGGGHHGLVHGAVVTQPRLAGIGGKQPDFLMVVRDSASVYVVLVELESPCKRWFTKVGTPTAEFSQALAQIRSWKTWFEDPGKAESFVHEYQVPRAFRDRRFEQRYLLIYGRRGELYESGFAASRSQHQQPDERLVSYDYLEPSQNYANAVTTRVNANGYEAHSLPPTLELGPFQASDLAMIKGKADAVRAHPMMTEERAAFLASRFDYWDDWVGNGERGGHGFEVE